MRKISRLTASNFMVFSNREIDINTIGINLDFSDGINILIGENATGKTTILKMIYAATQWSNSITAPGKTKKISDFFMLNAKTDIQLKSYKNENAFCYYEVLCGDNRFMWSLSHNGLLNLDDWLKLNLNSVFIPTIDMLSHSNDFLALNNKYQLPFDGTQLDIIVNAQLPELKKIPDDFSNVLENICEIIDGKVVFEDDSFYVQKNNGQKLPYEFESDGYKKFGLLYRLIVNGSINKDTILLWDEPESNINPELFSRLVDIMLNLQRLGVQVFVSTHNYVLAKYFDIKKSKLDKVKFHSLFHCENGIEAETSDCFSNLKNNPISKAFETLLDEVYTQEIGG